MKERMKMEGMDSNKASAKRMNGHETVTQRMNRNKQKQFMQCATFLSSDQMAGLIIEKA